MLNEVSPIEEIAYLYAKGLLERRLKRELTKDEDEELWTFILSKNKKTINPD